MSAGTPSLVLALDQGTTSSRAILFDKSGQIRATASREFPQHYPRPGWVEHDPADIWSSQEATVAEVMARSGANPDDVAAIGITNQRETTLVWDRKTGKPVHPAIVWQDRRTADRCRQLRDEGVAAEVTARTGMRLDPYFSGTKIEWILDQVDGARARAENGELLFGTVDTWLIWNLTRGRVFATDAGNASRTLLFNGTTGDWDERLLELFRVPRSMLPQVVDSSGILGTVASGLPLAGTAISGVAGDQQAALFGQTCFEPGMVKNTYGTGCFLLMQTGSERVVSNNNLLTTVAWRINGRTEYALEGSIFVAGALLQWLRDELGIIAHASECGVRAAEVPDSGGVVIVPAFTGLGAPHWDPHARGSILGLTRGAGRGHICRAALEAIAYQSADLIESMEKDSGRVLTELRVDGGVAQSDLMLQFQADLLGKPVVRPSVLETTALGAAYLAGLGVGFWTDRASIANHGSVDRIFEPSATDEEMRRGREFWARAVKRSLAWEESDG